MVNKKRCYRCGNTKTQAEFYKSKHQKSGYRGECKQCSKEIMREYAAKNPRKIKNYDLRFRLKNKYKITEEEYEQRGNNCDWKCEICGTSQLELKKPLVIDHDHVTNKVRGLLCSNCNHGLGHFKDKSEILKKAAAYVEVRGDIIHSA